jgi:hypothetical protein
LKCRYTDKDTKALIEVQRHRLKYRYSDSSTETQIKVQRPVHRWAVLAFSVLANACSPFLSHTSHKSDPSWIRTRVRRLSESALGFLTDSVTHQFHAHTKLIGINRRLFWMHLEVCKVVQGAAHVPHIPHVQGQTNREVKEGHEAH